MSELEHLQVGDKVFITDYYTSQYPGWVDGQKEATVLELFPTQMIPFSHLSATDLAKYKTHYGSAEKYPIVSMLIQIDASKYLVSQLGFDKR